MSFTAVGCSKKPANNGVIPSNNEIPNSNVLFYSTSCPHCLKVEAFLRQYDISSKVNFVQKEVSGDQENAQLLGKIAEKCNIPTDSIGIPLLWDGSKCMVGEEDITKFFKTKAGIE